VLVSAREGIIANMIELNNVESGELRLNVQQFSIRAAVHDVLQACSMGGHGEGGVSWVNEGEVALPELVEARTQVQLRACMAW
jgi:hypothetical protein